MTAVPATVASRWTTPRWLRAYVGAAWLAAALLYLVGLQALDADRGTLRIFRNDTAPGIVLAEDLGAQLAGLDTALADSMLLDRAREVRSAMSALAFWGNDEKEKEIVALLEGPSIELTPEATPLGQRTLLAAVTHDVRARPEELLAAMSSAFDHARDVVLAVKIAWEGLEPELGRIETQARDARAKARALGLEEGARADLDAIDRDLQVLRTRVARDPLGTSTEVASRLAPRLADLTARLSGLAAQRDRVLEGLDRARSTLLDARETHAAAVAAAQRMPLEIEGARSGVPVADEQVEGLGPWLDKIAETAAAGGWSSAEIGLGKWNEAAGAVLADEGRIVKALASVLARRDELEGRLAARRAQAAVIVARGEPPSPAAEALGLEAKALLDRRPTPLAKASDCVDRYESAVRGRARR